MSLIIKKHWNAICKNIYLALNTLIDILFTLFHLWTDKEDLSIKWATIFEFSANTTINIIDIFKKLWFPCSCCCNCCSKKKAEKELDYDEIIERNEQKIEDLELDIKILEKINSETNKSNEKYVLAKEQLIKIEELEQEKKRIKIA